MGITPVSALSAVSAAPQYTPPQQAGLVVDDFADVDFKPILPRRRRNGVLSEPGWITLL